MRILDTTLRCPGCSAKFKLAEGLIDSELTALAEMVSAFGPDWRAMQPYLSCFRTAQGKGLRPERLLLILDELAEIWRSKTFVLNKKTMTVSPVVLRAALAEMAHKSDSMTGLKNHNYFKKILENMMQKFNAQESKNENREIQRDKSGAGRAGDEWPEVSPETQAKTRELLDKVGKTLTPRERVGAARFKSPLKKGETGGCVSSVDREQAENLVREELTAAGWSPEKIEAELQNHTPRPDTSGHPS